MAYLGNIPARSFISFERQVFTIVNSQTAYTLDHSVTNENDIRLVVNNVVQEPGSGKAYTASGTTLTLSAALTNGTDEMYCVFLGRAIGTVNAPAGSVTTSQIAADAVNGDKIADDSISDEHLDPTAITGQTAETTIASDDLILLSDTSASGALKKMTQANFVSGVGGANTPTFLARKNGDMTSLASNTYHKVTGWTEIFDPQSTWDNSNSKWSPASAGKYFIFGTAWIEHVDGQRTFIAIYKNGSLLNQSAIGSGVGDNYPIQITAMDDNDGDDYYELYVSQRGTGTNIYSSGVTNQFGGFKIIT